MAMAAMVHKQTLWQLCSLNKQDVILRFRPGCLMKSKSAAVMVVDVDT